MIEEIVGLLKAMRRDIGKDAQDRGDETLMRILFDSSSAKGTIAADR